MNNPLGNSFDSTSDIGEIGLMAATSPDFAEAMLRALIAAADGANAGGSAGAAKETRPLHTCVTA